MYSKMLSNLDVMMYADDPLTGNKPVNCGVLSHHSNDKTNVIPRFQVHILLTGTMLLLSIFFYSHKRCKNKKTR